jgi:foldase protein PrsA
MTDKKETHKSKKAHETKSTHAKSHSNKKAGAPKHKDSGKTAKKVGTNYFSRQNAHIIGIILIVIAAVLILATSLVNHKTDSNVLVLVNGEQITQDQLDAQWDALPVQTKTQLTKEELLDEIVREQLLLQRAEELGITATQEEVNEFITSQLGQTGATIDQFKEVLTAQGVDYTQIEEIYTNQLIIAKLFDQTITDDQIAATEEEIQNFYEENRDLFEQEEQVTVRHILIQANEQVNESVVQERVDFILAGLENGTENFCEYVTNYTSDRASEPTCGEYTFPRGQMVPEFEQASFSMNVGEIEAVDSQFGTHIIEKLGETPSGTLELDDEVQSSGFTVETLVISQIEQEKAQSVFNTYIAELEEAAAIEYVGDITAETLE